MRILKYVKSKKSDYMVEDSTMFIHENKIYTVLQQNEDEFTIMDESLNVHSFSFVDNETYEWFDLFYGDIDM